MNSLSSLYRGSSAILEYNEEGRYEPMCAKELGTVQVLTETGERGGGQLKQPWSFLNRSIGE